jgi:D-proline reductase (dithiol) PrdB
VIEAQGIATVALSMIPEFTASVGAPRVAGIDYLFGRPMGLPGDRAGQRAVLQAALEVLAAARVPGTVVQLPFRWPQDPRQAGGDSPVPPPIVQLLKRKPWLALRLLAHDIPAPQQPATA